MTAHDSQMLKGLVTFLLLDLVADAPDYGYSLVVRLHEGGFTDLAEGTVYPALARCEQAGWVEAYLVPSGKGPARKYYRLTNAGAAERAHARDNWNHLSGLVAGLLSKGNAS